MGGFVVTMVYGFSVTEAAGAPRKVREDFTLQP